MPPMGLAYCASVLRNFGYEVKIFDASLEIEIDNNEWVKRILDFNPDILGITAITSSFFNGYEIAEKIKHKKDSIKVVFGGVHVSWGKEIILKEYPAIDFVIAGEGEYSMLKLAKQEPYSQIEGLYYRDGNEIKHGPDMTLCEMDKLPFPAYDLLYGFPKKYQMPLFSYKKYPGANIISSRGCIYQCSYCDRSVFGKGFRFNSPEYTFELCKYLYKNFGIRHINFYDDLFTVNRERVARLCELISKNKLNINFNCIVRLGHIDDELIRLLKNAGCFMVNVGIESGDQEILNRHKAGLTLETIKRDIKKLTDAGLYVKGLFMMGFPGETEDSIKKTMDFALSLPLKDANITAFTPFPGAPITSKISELGEFDSDWRKMDCENFVFIPKEIGSKEKLEYYYKKFIKSFYQRKYMRKIYAKMLLECPHSYYRIFKNIFSFGTYAFSLNKK